MAGADYDNDGKLDLLAMGFTTQGAGVTALYHNQDSVYKDVTGILPGLPGLGSGAFDWGDYDNDGRLDLIVLGSNGGYFVTKLYHNTGAASKMHPANYPFLPRWHLVMYHGKIMITTASLT